MVCRSQYNGSDCMSVFVPRSVVEIQDDAFWNCQDLREVVFEEGSALRTIGASAFRESGVECVDLPGSLRTLAQAAFAGCRNLRSVRLREGLKALGTRAEGQPWQGAFQGSALEEVLLPSTLRRIEHDTFRRCGRLRSVALPAGLAYLGKQCFCSSGLEAAVLPPALREIGRYAFYKCRRLRRVEFPEGLETIGLGAFHGSGIESAVLPASLRTVAQGAFARCGSLRTVVFRDGLEALGTREHADDGGRFHGVFEDSALENVELPKTLRRVE